MGNDSPPKFQEARPPRYSLPPAPARPDRAENPLLLPQFSHARSIVQRLLGGHYFTPKDWQRWFDLHEAFSRVRITSDLFRNIEYLFTEKELDLRPGHRLLDIGTGASPFPLFLSRRQPESIFILDLDPYGFPNQREYFGADLMKRAFLIQGDATAIPLAAQSVDRVSAISAIEHFPGDGDRLFMRSAWRILKPGGICVVTVPYRETFEENENVRHYHGGFERRYNREALAQRLWSEGKWILQRELYMNPGRSPLARKLIRRHGSLDLFFDKWYETRSNLRQSDHSLWYTLLLIELSDTPGPGCFGTCFALRKEM